MIIIVPLELRSLDTHLYPYTIRLHFIDFNYNNTYAFSICPQTILKIKSEAYSSQGSQTSQLNFCNWLADGPQTSSSATLGLNTHYSFNVNNVKIYTFTKFHLFSFLLFHSLLRQHLLSSVSFNEMETGKVN